MGLFNLIPGLPLDGGNILKALVWKITGNPYKGIQFAGRVGQVFGWVAIASGLLPLVLFGAGVNFWNVLIGWFLLQNAGQAAQYATVQDRLAGLTAADAVITASPVVTDTLTLREFADQRILDNRNWRKFLVADQDGQLLGTIAVDDLRLIPSEQWADTTVKALVTPVEPSLVVESDRPLSDVVTLLEERQITAMSVVRENGSLVGLLEKAAIIQLLQRDPVATPA